MIIQICIGSSCHIKGSQQIVELFEKAIKDYQLEDTVTLAGSFCTGNCNRIGVTVIVDDKTFTGITVDTFDDFFLQNVLGVLNEKL